MFYLGIDVGKTWHEAVLLIEADEILRRLRFRSSRSGLESLAQRLGSVAAWAGERATAVLNPLQTRAFRNANLRGSKTDRIDAVSIARLIRRAGRTLSTHAVPDERPAAAREIKPGTHGDDPPPSMARAAPPTVTSAPRMTPGRIPARLAPSAIARCAIPDAVRRSEQHHIRSGQRNTRRV